jgi:hypothetical protein
MNLSTHFFCSWLSAIEISHHHELVSVPTDPMRGALQRFTLKHDVSAHTSLARLANAHRKGKNERTISVVSLRASETQAAYSCQVKEAITLPAGRQNGSQFSR